MNPTTAPAKAIETLDSVIIRFAGDSGDGMQLTGTRFTETSAMAGNDVATLPDYPAEIRAPAGSLAGVSGFQLQFSNHDIHTPGDQPDVLIAMNPAALKRNLGDLPPGATIIANADAFTTKNLSRAGFEANPLEDESLEGYRVYGVPISKMTITALDDVDGLTPREKERCKNFFSLGLSFWMFGRTLEPTKEWIASKFGQTVTAAANITALQKGYDFGVTTEMIGTSYQVNPADDIAPGTYRNITGNEAAALGFVAASQLGKRDLVLGSYPITPASDILHELSKHKNIGVRTVQAEDEIAAVCVAIGAAYGGAIGLTTSAGPGIALKGEAIGLATSVELPLVVANIQRAGPSTGMPTKPEQSDLFQALFGRHGESPIAVVAPATPGECFELAIEAVRIATKYMTPVIFLSDAYLANTAEPWRVPDTSTLPDITVQTAQSNGTEFLPFSRDPETLARPWAVPGTPGLEHRIGGLEKAQGTGNISYDPANHQRMTDLRAEKIARIAHDIPELAVEGDADADVLVLGWGSTLGAIRGAVKVVRAKGKKVAHAHVRYLSPLPRNIEDVLTRYPRVLVPELNAGQLSFLLRGQFLADVRPMARVRGIPFRIAELVTEIESLLEDA